MEGIKTRETNHAPVIDYGTFFNMQVVVSLLNFFFKPIELHLLDLFG